MLLLNSIYLSVLSRIVFLLNYSCETQKFFKTGLLGASATLMDNPFDLVGQSKTQSTNFKLNYAPHAGMFKSSAPNGELNELDFMHEAGICAIADNEMRNRYVDFQNQFATRMQKHNMTMGFLPIAVFRLAILMEMAIRISS